MSKVANGNTITVHYKGTLEDGQMFDSSYERGDPITFQLGEGKMIPGFEKNLVGMEVGETKEFTITSEDAYGSPVPEGVQAVPKQMFPEDFVFEVGGVVQGQQDGNTLIGTILSEEEATVTLDFNHPMAGKDLTFNVEIVNIEQAPFWNEKEEE